MKKITLLFLLFLISSTTQAQVDRSKVHFADSIEAKAAIINDLTQPFFSIMMPLEMIAKTSDTFTTTDLNEMHGECRRRYQKGVLTFTEAEKEAILWFLDEVTPRLSGEYPKLGALDWNFIKLSNKIEGGLPHTRGKYIFLSEGTTNFMIASIEKAKAYPNTKNLIMIQLGGLLVHEQLHVFQRANPGIFDSIYINQFNFIKLTNKPVNDWIKKYNVFNPDAPNIDWVKRIVKDDDTTYVWPIVAINDQAVIPKMPDDFLMIGVTLKKDNGSFTIVTDSAGVPIYHNLLKIDGYYDGIPLIDRSLFAKETTFAEGHSSAYHPEEALASLFMTIFGYDRLPQNLMFEDKRMLYQSQVDQFKQIFQNYLK